MHGWNLDYAKHCRTLVLGIVAVLLEMLLQNQVAGVAEYSY
jgi:hypothetical protein